MLEILKDRLTTLLWAAGHENRPFPVRIGIDFLRYVAAITREFIKGDINLRAMSLIYTSLLSVVPLLAFSFSLLKGIGIHQRIEPVLYNFLQPLGDKGEELTAQIIGLVENVNGTVLGGLGLVLLMVTVLSMIQQVESSFNSVWRVQQPRSFASRISEYLTVILVGPVLMVVAMGMITAITSTTLVQKLSTIEPFGTTLLMLGKLTPTAIVILVFTFVYTFVPNTTVRIKSALIGGATAGIAWAGTGLVFANFVINSATTLAVYSGFAIVLFALIWLYLSWLILLIGAQVAFFHQNPKFLPPEAAEIRLNPQSMELLSLNIMYLIGLDFRVQNKYWSTQTLAERFGITSGLLGKVMTSLEQGGLITISDSGRILPGREMSRIKILHILAAVRNAPGAPEIPLEGPIEELNVDIKQAFDNVLGDKRLTDLFD